MLKRSSWVALAVVLVLVGCGSSEDDGGGGPADKPSSESTDLKDGELPKEYPFDTSGDDPDLLKPEKLSSRSYLGASLSWQFPVGYKQTYEDKAELEVDGITYELRIGGTRTKDTPRAFLEPLTLSASSSRAERLYSVELGDEDRAAFLDEGKYGSSIWFASQGADGFVTTVTFRARRSLADPNENILADFPPERIAELHQVVRSLRATPVDPS